MRLEYAIYNERLIAGKKRQKARYAKSRASKKRLLDEADYHAELARLLMMLVDIKGDMEGENGKN